MSIKTKTNDIIHTLDINFEINKIITENNNSKIFLLTDNNCFKYCFPLIKPNFPASVPIKIIKPGEKNKNLNTLSKIWNFLVEEGADRSSILINLGGGVITDIGGFAASTFKRGIRFINIPTSLTAQADASIGGKTGINYQSFKNEIGVISKAYKILIDPVFLKTLKKNELLSGFGEMIKHALIFDYEYYSEIKKFLTEKQTIEDLDKLIWRSVQIKEHFVKNDLYDSTTRQALNFGHTFGHAIETYINNSKPKKIKHGFAVAYGMICDMSISVNRYNFPENLFLEIKNLCFKYFGELKLKKNDLEKIYQFMLHDKKNNFNTIKTVLLKRVGEPVINCNLDKYEILRVLKIFL